MSHLRGFLTAGCLIAASCSFAQDQTAPAIALLKRSEPLVIAHRGFSARNPENTLPAFVQAKAAKADLVELDYYHSKDGKLVVFHDTTLDRTSDAKAKWGGEKIRLDSKTFDELRSLDVGAWFDPKFSGLKMPTLPEALDEIQNGGVTLIERKAGDAAACVTLLRERKEINRVIVQAFDWKYLADFHALEPQQVLGALGPPSYVGGRKLTEPEKTLTEAYVNQAMASGVKAIGWNSNVTAEAITYAHSKSLEIWIYTVNKPEEATRMLNMGADGIITDDPETIGKIVREHAASAVSKSRES